MKYQAYKKPWPLWIKTATSDWTGTKWNMVSRTTASNWTIESWMICLPILTGDGDDSDSDNILHPPLSSLFICHPSSLSSLSSLIPPSPSPTHLLISSSLFPSLSTTGTVTATWTWLSFLWAYGGSWTIVGLDSCAWPSIYSTGDKLRCDVVL